MEPVIFTWSLILLAVGLLLFGFYALVKKAVKDAFREIDREKSEPSKGNPRH